MGEALGYSAQTVSLWERGESAPSLSVLGKYAALLKVDLEGLLTGKEQKTNSYCEEKEFDAARFGSEIRRMRKNLDLTQEALAQKIGANARAVMRFERGESYPSVEQFLALCELFGKKPDELYFGLDLPVEAPPAPKKPTALIIGIAIGALLLGAGLGFGIAQITPKGNPSSTPAAPGLPSEASIAPADTSPIENRYPNTQSKIEIVDGKAEFGYYPQTHVADEETITKLNALTRKNLRGFYELDGDYYMQRTAAIYYDSHQPWESSFWFDDDTHIIDGKTYWFKVEPILWKVVEESDGEICLFTDKILDTGIPFSAVDNNWATSSIREWLNGEFVERAFGSLPDCVLKTTLDNSVREEDTPFHYEDTEDYVYLPSQYDISSWRYADGWGSPSMDPTATEYARCSDFFWDPFF